MKRTKAYLKSAAALLLASSMVFSDGAPLTLMKAFVSYATENIPGGSKPWGRPPTMMLTMTSR